MLRSQHYQNLLLQRLNKKNEKCIRIIPKYRII